MSVDLPLRPVPYRIGNICSSVTPVSARPQSCCQYLINRALSANTSCSVANQLGHCAFGVVDRRREFGDQVGLGVRPYQGWRLPPEVERAVPAVEQPRVGVQVLRQDRDAGLGSREADHRRHPLVIFRLPRPRPQTRRAVGVVRICKRHLLRLYRPRRAFRAPGEDPQAVAVPAAAVPVEPLAPRVAVPDSGAELVRQPLAVADVRGFVRTGQRSRIQSARDNPRLGRFSGRFGRSGRCVALVPLSVAVTVWRPVLAVA